MKIFIISPYSVVSRGGKHIMVEQGRIMWQDMTYHRYNDWRKGDFRNILHVVKGQGNFTQLYSSVLSVGSLTTRGVTYTAHSQST